MKPEAFEPHAARPAPARRMLRAVSALCTLLPFAVAPIAASADPVWPVAGRQGIIQVVIVPDDAARDRDAYLKQIDALCAPNQSCFINFFTNSTGAPVAVPLPDAIEHEATAVFRRSTKQGGEFLRWSCRLKLAENDCF